MKTVLISLLLLVATTAKAQEVINSEKVGASTFTQLELTAVTRNMSLINPRFKAITSASISFNDKNLTLTLNKFMPNCRDGMICIQVIPVSLKIKLAVVNIEQTKCAVKYTAVTPANLATNLQEEIIVEDLTNSKCPTTKPMPQVIGHIIYKATGISNSSQKQETATANFSAFRAEAVEVDGTL